MAQERVSKQVQAVTSQVSWAMFFGPLKVSCLLLCNANVVLLCMKEPVGSAPLTGAALGGAKSEVNEMGAVMVMECTTYDSQWKCSTC